ncbi:alpha-amylase family glycosyl hydrolase [bacterium]|jgi:glycosidase|nr:alpha-amylase family glycosyl hydrolase [bacterium]
MVKKPIKVKRYFPLEFQLSKRQWDTYRLKEGIFNDPEEPKPPCLPLIRKIVKRIYEIKGHELFAKNPLRAGKLNAAGLINEVFRHIIMLYENNTNPEALKKTLDYSSKKMKSPDFLETFISHFPPYDVIRARRAEKEYLLNKTDSMPNTELTALEMILLHLANKNKAVSSYREFFDDKELSEKTPYAKTLKAFREFLDKEPGFGKNNKPIIDFLLEPIQASEDSLEGQLKYIKDNWAEFLPEDILNRILTALDVLKEEEKEGWLGKGPNLVMRFKDLSDYPEYAKYTHSPEYEHFSEDKNWMSKVVIIAKSTYVWLDQLSKKYSRPINKIDLIPDEELDRLADWGFTGLWLIGIWERSPASQKIKQICGNPEALASAYSLYDYTISADLGGETAFQSLKARAWQRGIRLATDVVPNHMGVYSKWVIEHPDWFIQLDYPPYPGYSFSGPDISDDQRVSIQIEDGYWTKRDAAVVFKRYDKHTGSTKYMYHGNDGTSMPWNDTAQLNFLKEEVREAVIQSILNVARHFSIIRLDAAMTLAKRHYQRLWFPHPGTGGGIPSRAENGLSTEDFNRLMPREFWREVVDRVNKELPDTLLLAEAFWLMEGFFVRTLGMHRVYNSSFMNMLKMEENQKYRQVVKNILEFNPQILKRFVNFQNNPDEETAVAQFGKGDKYFGVCLMMVTMPGLPMFGHGQIEGFAEKYGMEYRKAYRDEETDWDLVKRHEADIFPLMKKRHLFSEVDNFLMYDFYRNDGSVDENVFAFSNICGGEKGLVIYHNKYASTSGWIKSSCAISVETGRGKRHLIRKTLAEGLNIKNSENTFYLFRDYKSGLQYIRNGRDLHEKGLFLGLEAYQYHSFLDFSEIEDTKGHYREIARLLDGKGIYDIREMLREMILSPVHNSLCHIINNHFIKELLVQDKRASEDLPNRLEKFYGAVKSYYESAADIKTIAKDAKKEFDSLLDIAKSPKTGKTGQYLHSQDLDSVNFFKKAVLIIILKHLKEIYAADNMRIIEELSLEKAIFRELKETGQDDLPASQDSLLLKIVSSYPEGLGEAKTEKPKDALNRIFKDGFVSHYLDFNEYEGILWFNKEKFEILLYWLFITALINSREPGKSATLYKPVSEIYKALQKSEYKVNKLLELIA